MTDNIEIGKRIKSCREEMGLTQAELGATLGLNKSTIQRYESGKVSRIKLPILESIADELGVNPEYLALESDDRINYEKTNENLEVPLDVLRHFDGDAEKVYDYEQTIKNGIDNEQQFTLYHEQMHFILHQLSNIPKEDRDQLIKSFQQTIDIYLAAKGSKKKNDD